MSTEVKKEPSSISIICLAEIMLPVSIELSADYYSEQERRKFGVNLLARLSVVHIFLSL
jgi:hypothetical protein